MAILSDNARLQIWRALQRYWSNLWELVNLGKSDLLAAIVATADLTAGDIDFHAQWMPLTTNGNVVAT